MTTCTCQLCVLFRQRDAIKDSGTREDLLAMVDQVIELWWQEREDRVLLKTCGVKMEGE